MADEIIDGAQTPAEEQEAPAVPEVTPQIETQPVSNFAESNVREMLKRQDARHLEEMRKLREDLTNTFEEKTKSKIETMRYEFELGNFMATVKQEFINAETKKSILTSLMEEKRKRPDESFSTLFEEQTKERTDIFLQRGPGAIGLIRSVSEQEQEQSTATGKLKSGNHAFV